jgi:hypothetical protein
VGSGTMTVWAGPDKAALRSGDYYHVPLDTPHTFHAGPEGARALIISSPAGFAEAIAGAGTRPTWPPRRPNSTPTCSWRWPPSSATSCWARREPPRPTSPGNNPVPQPVPGGSDPISITTRVREACRINSLTCTGPRSG